jgi:hypothetical protein
MTSIGCTGHRDLPSGALAYVRSGILAELPHDSDHLVGICSLAIGADQLFARLVLDVGGQLHVVIPSSRYEDTFAPDEIGPYRALLDRARESETLAFPEPSEDAFLAAGKRVAELSDALIAVWDGQPALGKGGTADIVAFARGRAITTRIVWPPGVSR